MTKTYTLTLTDDETTYLDLAIAFAQRAIRTQAHLDDGDYNRLEGLEALRKRVNAAIEEQAA